MNNLTSSQVCAAAKVIGCILGLSLAVVGMIMVPYFSVIIGFAIILLLLWYNTDSLPKSSFKIALLGVAGGIIPSLCGVIYWLILLGDKIDGPPAPTFILNLLSILLMAILVPMLMMSYVLVVALFDHFLRGCTDQKIPDNGVAPDGDIKETDASVLAK